MSSSRGLSICYDIMDYHDGLLYTIIEGRIDGKKERGSKRHPMLDDIMEKEVWQHEKNIQ